MIKNHIEIKGDVALIHINSKGKTVYAMIDIEDLSLLKPFHNRLTLDSQGAVQHRVRENGSWENGVHQLHRLIVGIHSDFIRVGFKNGNKLDCRKQNLRIEYMIPKNY